MSITGVIDADTIVYRCSTLCQTAYDVVSKETGSIIDYATSKKDYRKTLPEGGEELIEFVHNVRPARPESGVEPEVMGYHAINMEMNRLMNRFDGIDKYEICIHGGGNFREELATIKPYKGNRPPKPLFLKEVKDFLIKNYRDQIVIIEGEETDDYVARCGWRAWERCKDKKTFSDTDTLLFHIDKDIDQVPGWHYNYNKDKEYIVTTREAAKSFWTQCVMGDGGDNIPGIPKISDAMKEKYEFKSSAGYGVKSAAALFKDCVTSKDYAERFVEAFKDGYGDDWLEAAQEICSLIYLRKEEGVNFDLKKTLYMLGVDYA